MATFKFNVGDELKDTITGFAGIVMARTEWLNGCLRYQLQPKKLKDGKMQDEAVFDEQQLVMVKPAKKPEETKPFRGGPQRDSRSPVRTLLR